MNTTWITIGMVAAVGCYGACLAVFFERRLAGLLESVMATTRHFRCRLIPFALMAAAITYAGAKPGPGPGPGPEPVKSWQVGRLLKVDLVKDLGVEITADYRAGDKVAVKLETLPKGLKLVTTQLKDNSAKKTVTNVVYTIEGVPTETLDPETQPLYARVTVTKKENGKSVKDETLQKTNFEIVAAEPEALEAFLNENIKEPKLVTDIWTNGVDVSKWSFKGWPAGVKYTTKYIPKNDKTGMPEIQAYSIYGKPTKAGVFTVTATTKEKEQFFLTFTVWPSDEEKKFRYVSQAYVDVVTNLGDRVAAASGLPKGLKFKAGEVSGTPTKLGVYAVQVTKKDPNDPQGKKTLKEKEVFLWKITDGENPGLGVEKIDWVGGEVEWDDKMMTATALQGAAIDLAVDLSDLNEKAKVTISGLPSGLKYDAKNKRITGVATKVEKKVVVIKVVQNGVTVTKRLAFVIISNPFAGVYRGGAVTERAEGDLRLAMFEVTVAVGGKVSISYNEGKTKYAASAKSYDYGLSSATGTVKSLIFKASANDKKAGMGNRTAELRFCSHEGRFQEAQVFIGGELAGTGFASVKSLDEGVTLPPLQTYVFTNEVGLSLATVSVAYNAKKATAAFTGKLFDNTAVKMSVPVCRWACESNAADYVFAPFQIVAKDKTVYLFNSFAPIDAEGMTAGGAIDWVFEGELKTAHNSAIILSE